MNQAVFSVSLKDKKYEQNIILDERNIEVLEGLKSLVALQHGQFYCYTGLVALQHRQFYCYRCLVALQHGRFYCYSGLVALHT